MFQSNDDEALGGEFEAHGGVGGSVAADAVREDDDGVGGAGVEGHGLPQGRDVHVPCRNETQSVIYIYLLHSCLKAVQFRSVHQLYSSVQFSSRGNPLRLLGL